MLKNSITQFAEGFIMQISTAHKHIFLYLILLLATSFLWAESPTSPTVNTEPEWQYTFRPNDTIWQVCKEYCMVENCWLVLSQYNHISKDRAIPPGTKISIPTKWLKSQPIAATVVRTVDAQKLTRLNEQIPLIRGDTIELQESIITGQHFASVELADNSLLSIAPNSRITFDKISLDKKGLIVNTNIQLHRGSVSSDIKKRPETHFQIQTPSAVAAVRGTIFRTSYDETSQTMRTEVDHGVIDMNSIHGTTELLAGYASSAKKDAAPSAAIKRLLAPDVDIDTKKDFRPGDTIKWQKNATAAYYVMDIADANSSTNIISSHTSTQPHISLPPITSGKYQMIVRAIDLAGFNGMPAIYTISVDDSPIIPSIKLDWNHKKSELEWSPEKQVTGIEYILELSNKKDFSNILHSIPLNTEALDTEKSAITIKQPVKYARIKASNHKDSKFSKIVSLQKNYKIWYWLTGLSLTGMAATALFIVIVL